MAELSKLSSAAWAIIGSQQFRSTESSEKVREMNGAEQFNALVVRRDEYGSFSRQIETLTAADLPSADVRIRVEWSSLNYKDALAAEAHPGVAGKLPHVPGIDAAGVIVAADDERFEVGQQVLVTGHELGARQWGGWSGEIRVPGDWVIPLPADLTTREAMIIGTAGFTAAQSLLKLEQQGITPDSGPILVTGATGGVGCLAVRLLAASGYEVVASTGKADAESWLRDLGAAEVISREAVTGAVDGKRPLFSTRWAGAVDTVGGSTLATVLASTKLHGCVTACGLVAGSDLPTTVYPFILRGVTLVGITSQNCPRETRITIWQAFATRWKFDLATVLAGTAELSELEPHIAQILAGGVRGRTLVKLSSPDVR